MPKLYENFNENNFKALTDLRYPLAVSEPERLPHRRSNYYKSSNVSQICVSL